MKQISRFLCSSLSSPEQLCYVAVSHQAWCNSLAYILRLFIQKSHPYNFSLDDTLTQGWSLDSFIWTNIIVQCYQEVEMNVHIHVNIVSNVNKCMSTLAPITDGIRLKDSSGCAMLFPYIKRITGSRWQRYNGNTLGDSLCGPPILHGLPPVPAMSGMMGIAVPQHLEGWKSPVPAFSMFKQGEVPLNSILLIFC